MFQFSKKSGTCLEHWNMPTTPKRFCTCDMSHAAGVFWGCAGCVPAQRVTCHTASLPHLPAAPHPAMTVPAPAPCDMSHGLTTGAATRPRSLTRPPADSPTHPIRTITRGTKKGAAFAAPVLLFRLLGRCAKPDRRSHRRVERCQQFRRTILRLLKLGACIEGPVVCLLRARQLNDRAARLRVTLT